ncbi:hypothetical protein GCM10025864_37870 [Luteimicrobium album]|uniref:MFS transporter n=2 Tax=Luteimicrobium album TaxID=1054550 RepID=A0ABQ6I7B0_9MICO|nr:hypothetical protein GCM10025864_37870 [Luteimicrobium album]
MREDRVRAGAPSERARFRDLVRTFRTGVRAARRSRVVSGLVLVSLLAGLSTEVFDRLWTSQVVDAWGGPTAFGITSGAAWFTVFALVGSALALLASLLVDRWRPAMLRHAHPHRLLAVLTALQVAGVVGFATSGSLAPALAAMWVRDAARAVAQPVQAAWLHRSIDSDTRATVASLTGQADALGQVVGGPPLGALASRTSVPLALLVSAAVYAPAIEVFRRLRPNPRPTGHEAAPRNS